MYLSRFRICCVPSFVHENGVLVNFGIRDHVGLRRDLSSWDCGDGIGAPIVGGFGRALRGEPPEELGN